MTETKPKRRWFRFDLLQTLLIVLILLFALLEIVLIWMGVQVIRQMI